MTGEKQNSIHTESEDTILSDTSHDDIIYNNIAIHCSLKGDAERFIQCFEDNEDPYFETVSDMINKREDGGKSPLDVASQLGRIAMVKELILRGAEVNSATSTGYTALHHGSAWGKVGCLKVLAENGADLHTKTASGERAREVAFRYNQMESVDYLDWAEAKQALLQAIQTMRDTLTDPEKLQGRLTRDDRKSTEAVCAEKVLWAENTSDATTKDFIEAKQAFDETVAPIWQKLSEPPPEKPEKK